MAPSPKSDHILRSGSWWLCDASVQHSLSDESAQEVSSQDAQTITRYDEERTRKQVVDRILARKKQGFLQWPGPIKQPVRVGEDIHGYSILRQCHIVSLNLSTSFKLMYVGYYLLGNARFIQEVAWQKGRCHISAVCSWIPPVRIACCSKALA